VRLGWRLEAVGATPCADEASLLGLLEGLPDATFVFATTANAPPRLAAATPPPAAVTPAPAATLASARPAAEPAARVAPAGGAKSVAVREAEALSALLAGLVAGDANGALALAYQAHATPAEAADGGPPDHLAEGDLPTVGAPLKQPVADYLTDAGLLRDVAVAVADFVRAEFEAGCAEDLAVLDQVTTC
jgi:hypothetical protein